MIFFTLGLNNSAISQSGAFCTSNCAGGCGVSGFDWASCGSSACVCWCVTTLDGEIDTFVTSCVGLGGGHQQ